jgi:hypothetical protein
MYLHIIALGDIFERAPSRYMSNGNMNTVNDLDPNNHSSSTPISVANISKKGLRKRLYILYICLD